MGGIFQIVIGTAGHIDHGKSSLVKLLTGLDPDRLKEEKDREMTIDLGFAPLHLPDGREIGIIDVPGHERFVKNMVAGATSIDFVLFVISAYEGVMPQTREHLEIMQLLHIPKGMVVMTKRDLVDQELLELAQEEVREFLKGSFLEKAPIMAISNTTGAGLDAFKKVLFQELASIAPHSPEGVFRMPIQRIFSSHGYGTVITGVPVSGKVTIGDVIEILPGGQRGRIKKIQAYGENIDCAQAGHSTALNIKDVDYKDVSRGQVAAAPGYFEPAHFLEARFIYAKNHEKPLQYLTPIRFHTGTIEEIGKLAILGKPYLEPGEEGYVQIRLDNPVVAVPGDRFVVRLASPTITIGGGVIVSIGEKKLKPFRDEVLAKVQAKEQALNSLETKIELSLKAKGLTLTKEDELYKISQREVDEVRPILQALVAQGKMVAVGERNPRYIHSDNLQEAEQRLVQKVGKFFADHPYRIYVGKVKIQNELGWEGNFWELVLTRVLQSNRLACQQDMLFVPGREVVFSEAQKQLLQKLEDRFRTELFSSPSLEELPQFCAKPVEECEQLVQYLEDKGTLVEVAKGLLLHHTAVTKAKNIVIETIRTKGEITAADLRDRLQSSRKYIIPLLEYFDQSGLTLRKGNSRVLK